VSAERIELVRDLIEARLPAHLVLDPDVALALDAAAAGARVAVEGEEPDLQDPLLADAWAIGVTAAAVTAALEWLGRPDAVEVVDRILADLAHDVGADDVVLLAATEGGVPGRPAAGDPAAAPDDAADGTPADVAADELPTLTASLASLRPRVVEAVHDAARTLLEVDEFLSGGPGGATG
jgi:hypothetical protein